jgi:uncharacterized protein (TIGR00288 family)
MSNDSRRPDVAVFIDFENVYVSVRDKLDANPNFEMIMDRCEDLGRVVIARAYADWYRYPRVTSALYANGVEPMYVPTYYYDRDLGRTGRAIKNSVDMNLCIDAMKTLFTNPNIAKFVLCTGDRDFIPLVNSIRQQGKEVIIIGIGGAASSHLAQSADEFVFYESLIGKRPVELQDDQPRARMPEKGREYEYEAPDVPSREAREAREPREARSSREPREARETREPREPRETREAREPVAAETDIFDTLVRAVHLARERDFVCSFGSLKLLMKELTSGEFREDKHRDAAGKPFAKFKDFVMEAERRGKVQVFTNGAVNEVFLPGEDPYKLSRFAMDLKEEPTPVRPAPVAEERTERQPVGGRRRRRRSRGRGQATGAELQNGELLETGDESEELDLTFLEVVASDGGVDESRFEELLSQLDSEDERTGEEQPLEIELDDPSIGESPSNQPELEYTAPIIEDTPVVAPAIDDSASQPETITLPFTDDEWSLLAELMARTEKALTFVQIHDLLRTARNRSGITRTNEELRTFIKQAINTGKLSRSGKGNRIAYRLAVVEPGETQAETTEVPFMEASIVEVPTGEVAPAVEAEATSDEPVVKAAKPARKRSSSKKKAAPEPVAEVVPEPEPVAEVVPAEPEAAPATKRPRRKKKEE